MKSKNYNKHLIMNSFLKNEYNINLWKKFIESPTCKNNKELNDAFKDFFTELKFTSYILSLIHYSSIDFDKKRN